MSKLLFPHWKWMVTTAIRFKSYDLFFYSSHKAITLEVLLKNSEWFICTTLMVRLWSFLDLAALGHHSLSFYGRNQHEHSSV